ncbi:MAG: glutamate racemase [Candidatus Nitrotoga sp. CP45]|nr:MAG: glutamate racemase [Candidatus Nitrotoga sp. CP45]
MTTHKIGVFDSGVGGLSVAKAIEKALPNIEVVFANDPEHVPYGSKSPEEVLKYIVPILEDLVKQGCDVVVIACNTVTTTLIKQLRDTFTVPLIGMEPMVKVAAAQTKSGIVAMCATPATLASERYEWLKKTYADNISVIEPDCSEWSKMIEASDIDREFIAKQVNDVCEQKADVIVLGCTHYHWIEEDIRAIAAGRALVLQPEQPVIRRLVRVLEVLVSNKAPRRKQRGINCALQSAGFQPAFTNTVLPKHPSKTKVR